jgi:hypothetical protein
MQALRQNREILPFDQRYQRRLKVHRTAPEKRSCRTIADDFLNRGFQQVILGTDLLKSQKTAEAHFFASLGHICMAYGLPGFPESDLPYPLNIKTAFELVKAEVDKKSDYEKLFLVENGEYPFCLATAMPWSTGHTLYFIPLQQVMRLLYRGKKCRAEAEIILSAYAYLMQVAKVPSYTKGGSLYGVYDSLGGWLQEDPDCGGIILSWRSPNWRRQDTLAGSCRKRSATRIIWTHGGIG